MITPDLLRSLLSTSTQGPWDSDDAYSVGAGPDRWIATTTDCQPDEEDRANIALMALARELAEAWLRVVAWADEMDEEGLSFGARNLRRTLTGETDQPPLSDHPPQFRPDQRVDEPIICTQCDGQVCIDGWPERMNSWIHVRDVGRVGAPVRAVTGEAV